MNEFWAAIFGALIGGAIAAALQGWNLAESRRQRAEQEADRKRGLGLALEVKLMRIHSNNHNIYRDLDEGVAECIRQGLPGPAWNFIQAPGNVPDRVSFTPDELGLLISLKASATTKAVLARDDIHNGLISLIELYVRERANLKSQLTPKMMNGLVGTVELDQAALARLAPLMAELNDLVGQLAERARIDFEESGDALEKLKALLEQKLKLDFPFRVVRSLAPISTPAFSSGSPPPPP